MIVYFRSGILPAMPMDQEKLKARRSKLGLTQAQVAERAGMSQQNYARIETGDRNDPNFSTAERIADALETSIDDLRESKKRNRSK